MENTVSPAGNALAQVPLSDTFPAAVPQSAPVLHCHSTPLPGRENSEEFSHKTSHYLDINIPVVSWVDAPYAEHLPCLKHVFILPVGAPS